MKHTLEVLWDLFVLFVLGALSVYLSANLFHWVLNKLDSTLAGQERYYYCDDCSNPILSSCYNSTEKLENFQWDLCQLKEHNGKYRKTIYQSPEYLSWMKNTKVNINIF